MWLRFAIMGLLMLWTAVYTGSLAVALWRLGNRRGAVIAGLLLVLSVSVPIMVEVVHKVR